MMTYEKVSGGSCRWHTPNPGSLFDIYFSQVQKFSYDIRTQRHLTTPRGDHHLYLFSSSDTQAAFVSFLALYMIFFFLWTEKIFVILVPRPSEPKAFLFPLPPFCCQPFRGSVRRRQGRDTDTDSSPAVAQYFLVFKEDTDCYVVGICFCDFNK